MESQLSCSSAGAAVAVLVVEAGVVVEADSTVSDSVALLVHCRAFFYNDRTLLRNTPANSYVCEIGRAHV